MTGYISMRQQTIASFAPHRGVEKKMAMSKLFAFQILCLYILYSCVVCQSESEVKPYNIEESADVRAEKDHVSNSLVLLMFMALLILTILSIWVIKHFRLRYIHETGLSILYGKHI